GQCKPLLRPTGLYLSSDLGPRSQNPILALITPILGGKRVKFPIPRQNQDMARHFKELIESGKFKPVVDRTYPLEQIVEAYQYVETGQKICHVVIVTHPQNWAGPLPPSSPPASSSLPAGSSWCPPNC